MTQREFFEKVIASVNDTEMVDFAKSRIAQLDKENERKKNTLNKNQVANKELKKTILATLTTTPIMAYELGEKLGISTSKASSLLTQLVKEEKVNKTEISVKGKGKTNHYSLA